MKSNKSGVTATYSYDKWYDDAPNWHNDFVKVIRCKDCKHLRIVNRQELAAMCSFHCYKFEPFADDYRECFCSWAERKEE